MRPTIRALIVATVTVAAGALLAAGIAIGKPGGVPAIPLNAEQETGTVVSDATGFFSYTIEGNQLCYTLEVSGLTTQPIGAHIHLGPRNVAGGIIVPLLTPTGTTSTVSECITAVEGGRLTPAELAAIEADPGAYYVNVHTTRYPGGEIRGQLK